MFQERGRRPNEVNWKWKTSIETKQREAKQYEKGSLCTIDMVVRNEIKYHIKIMNIIINRITNRALFDHIFIVSVCNKHGLCDSKAIIVGMFEQKREAENNFRSLNETVFFLSISKFLRSLLSKSNARLLSFTDPLCIDYKTIDWPDYKLSHFEMVLISTN